MYEYNILQKYINSQISIVVGIIETEMQNHSWKKFP